jgi:hypothetical protein
MEYRAIQMRSWRYPAFTEPVQATTVLEGAFSRAWEACRFRAGIRRSGDKKIVA